jgi:SAM-dependent methyltransferase
MSTPRANKATDQMKRRIAKAGKLRKAAKQGKRAKPPWLADQALTLLLEQYAFETVLDVGCGDGGHARHFVAHGKRVTTVSFEPYGDHRPDFVGDFMDFPIDERFDVVWCSHALEHQANVRQFLQRLFDCIKPGGLLAITVPPARPYIVGGHLTVWNTGLLLYNLIAAGIDCREARVKVYGYNISLIVPVHRIALPDLRHDLGDIERLAPFFPMPVQQGFDGRIEQIGWTRPPAAIETRRERDTMDLASFVRVQPCCRSDLDTLSMVADAHCPAGHVMEFGVFRGRSITALATALPDRIIHGFDTFTGLPLPWQRGPGDLYSVGHFGVDALPDVPGNVRLWPGEFATSLPAWLDAHPGPAALIHIDCDLYESTRTVLSMLDGRIVPGTVLVFDELCDWTDSGVYPAWREGEWRALNEWIERTGRRMRVLARGPRYSAAIRILAEQA